MVKLAKRAAVAILRHGTVQRRALRAGAQRGRRLILCYHRIAPDDGGEQAIAPLPPHIFARQLRALQDLGDIVSLSELISSPEPRDRPLFAVTFDDDDPSHVEHALPVLCDVGVSATFFFSARQLHGLGAYWWTLLERSVEEIGLAATGRAVGYQASSLTELVRTCHDAGGVRELPATTHPAVMKTEDIRTLADAGQHIGFHTVRHPALPLLSDDELATAMREGRDELACVAGQPIDLIAYPYGWADARVAAAAESAGFRAGFTTTERAVSVDSHRFLLPRWQPAPRDIDEFGAEAALRLAPPLVAAARWDRRPMTCRAAAPQL